MTKRDNDEIMREADRKVKMCVDPRDADKMKAGRACVFKPFFLTEAPPYNVTNFTLDISGVGQ